MNGVMANIHDAFTDRSLLSDIAPRLVDWEVDWPPRSPLDLPSSSPSVTAPQSALVEGLERMRTDGRFASNDHREDAREEGVANDITRDPRYPKRNGTKNLSNRIVINMVMHAVMK